MNWSLAVASAIYFAFMGIADAKIFHCKGTRANDGTNLPQTVSVSTPPTIRPGGTFSFRTVDGQQKDLNTRQLLSQGLLEWSVLNGPTKRFSLFQTTDEDRFGYIIGVGMTPQGYVVSIRIDTRRTNMPFMMLYTGDPVADGPITGTCAK